MVCALVASLAERLLEPLVCLYMNRVVLVAQRSRCETLLESLGFRRGAVFICTTNVQRLPVASAWSLT